jgi:hypothetical protein
MGRGVVGQESMEHKLRELRTELDKGQRHLELLDRQRQEVRDTLLRITGAIQVLEELLEAPSGELPSGANGAAVRDGNEAQETVTG